MPDAPPPPRPPPAARGTVAKPRQQRLGLDPDYVLAFLRQLEQERRARTWLGLLGGVALCVVGTFLVTAFFYLIVPIGGHGFLVAFCLVGLVTLPLMFLFAHYMGGSILEGAADGFVFSNRFTAHVIGQFYVVAEIANFGPRLTLWSIARLRSRAAVGTADLERAAAAVVALAAAEGGIKPAALLQPGEPPEALEGLLAYLIHFDLADVGSRGDRVWLTSLAKGKLGVPG